MQTIDLSRSTVLVTGANRGFGRHFAEQLVAQGAKVYAGARRPETVDLAGVDRDPARHHRSGFDRRGGGPGSRRHRGDQQRRHLDESSLLSGDPADVRREFDTHVFGTLDVVRAFAPVIEGNGGGAILNVLSVLSWISFADGGAYCAAKSAEWSMTNALRIELAPRNIRVSGLHVGYMDTDMTAGVDAPKSDPAAVAKFALDQLAAGSPEILADELSKQVQAGLAGGVAALYPSVA